MNTPQRFFSGTGAPPAPIDVDHNLLVESLIQALETMAFLSADPPDDHPIPPGAGTPFRVSVSFHGPFRGMLQLDAPLALGETLATILFCGDPSDPEMAMHAEDSLSELGNVTCGLLLRKLSVLHGGHFELQVPKWAPEPASPDWNDLTAIPGTVALRVEGLPLLARVTECPTTGAF